MRMWFWIKNGSVAELQASISSPEMWSPDWPGLARGGRTVCLWVFKGTLGFNKTPRGRGAVCCNTGRCDMWDVL